MKDAVWPTTITTTDTATAQFTWDAFVKNVTAVPIPGQANNTANTNTAVVETGPPKPPA